jgi:hypothetical protein
MGDPNSHGVLTGGSYEAVCRNLLNLMGFADREEVIPETPVKRLKKPHAIS